MTRNDDHALDHKSASQRVFSTATEFSLVCSLYVSWVIVTRKDHLSTLVLFPAHYRSQIKCVSDTNPKQFSHIFANVGKLCSTWQVENLPKRSIRRSFFRNVLFWYSVIIYRLNICGALEVWQRTDLHDSRHSDPGFRSFTASGTREWCTGQPLP